MRGDADKAKAVALENRLAGRIIRLEVLVNAAIDLDRQIVLMAIEVKDKTTKHELSSEFQAKKPAFAEHVPRKPLGVGLVSTQLACPKSLGEFWHCQNRASHPSPAKQERGRG